MPPISKLTQQYTETEIDGEIVIMRLDTGEFFAISGTAAAAWRLIDGSRDRHSLIHALAGEYETDGETILDDVDRLLFDLQSAGILAHC